MNGAQAGVQAWWNRTLARRPHIPYCATGCRFCNCPRCCLDCSGAGSLSYKEGAGVVVPTDTAAVSIWAEPKGYWRPVVGAPVSSILVHDKLGKPKQSGGARGHWGTKITEQLNGPGRPGWWVLTFESAGSGSGVCTKWRRADWWTIAIVVPEISGGAQAAPAKPKPPPEETDMPVLVKGDQTDHVYITDGIKKRWLETEFHVNKWKEPKPNVVTNGNYSVMAQATVDQIPLSKDSKVPTGYNGAREKT